MENIEEPIDVEWEEGLPLDFLTAQELIDILERVDGETPVRFWIADGVEVLATDIYDDDPDPPKDRDTAFPDLRPEASSVNIDLSWED